MGEVRIRLSGRAAGRACDVLAGRRPAAQPRDAATVMLLRPASPGSTDPGFEVYMLRRKTSMAFAPGAFAFPGGSADDSDAEQQPGWAGPSPDEWGRMLGAPPDLAKALVCAAVRETFEETGVLLAGPAAGSAADVAGSSWEADRQALLRRSVSLAGLLRARGLVLRSDLLAPWSRWITPAAEERRYDARFFVAALPAGQRTRDVGGEADTVAWVRPSEAITMGRRGEVLLMPPTAVSLAELAAAGDIAAVLTADRQIRPVLLQASVAGGAVWLTIPPELGYPL